MSVLDHSNELEMSAIGSTLLSAEATKDILGTLEEGDFYFPHHQLIFRAVKALFEAGKPIEMITLEEEMTLVGTIDRIGQPDYLLEIAMFTPSAANSLYYAERVKFYSGLRQDKKNARELMRLSEEGVPEAERDGFKSGLLKASLDPSARAIFRHIAECESKDGRGGGVVKSTWPHLDALNYQGGFPRGQATVVKAESGKGKTSWAISTALRLAELEGYSVLYASFADLTAEHIYYRMLRAMTGFSEPSTLEEHEVEEGAKEKLRKLAIYVYDAAEVVGGDNEIETFAAWFKARLKERKYDVVILDYAQEIQSGRQFKTPYEAQAYIARYVRILAQQTHTAILVLSQVNSDGQTSDSRNWKKISAFELMILNEGARVDKNRFGGLTGMVVPHAFDERRQVYVDR